MSFTAVHRRGDGPPLVALHGITDTWRTWELVLPALEREHEVLAPTLAGHAGGPPIEGEVTDAVIADAVERAMDEAGWETAHIVGNSLGGYVAFQLAARGRATSVVALAPAGGWAEGDDSYLETLQYFEMAQELLKTAGAYADQIASTPEGRRRATEFIAVAYEHIPADLIAHQIRGAAECPAIADLIAYVRREGWSVATPEAECPVRIVWGTEDRILPLPAAAAGYREAFPQADWIELDGVGHCPQLDVPAETAELINGFSR